jgi:hypothetical protein
MTRSPRRHADASRTTRRKPLPGFWHATITPPSPWFEAAPASAVVLSSATVASTPAVAIARPSTSTPFVDDADRRIPLLRGEPDGRTGQVPPMPHG